MSEMVGRLTRFLAMLDKGCVCYAMGERLEPDDLRALLAYSIEIEGLRRRVELCEAALKPFAVAADDLDDEHGDHSAIWEAGAAMSITAGHLREARSVLTETRNDAVQRRD